MEGKMKDDRSHRRDQHHHKSKHSGDKPGSARCVLCRGLGDAEGVDERIGQEEQRAHDVWMLMVNTKEQVFYASAAFGRHLMMRAGCYGSGACTGVD